MGEQLAAILGLPFLCLDVLSHQPHWQDTPPDIFRQQVKEFIASNPNGWIIDGNYRKVVGDITWKAATDIVWALARLSDFCCFVETVVQNH